MYVVDQNGRKRKIPEENFRNNRGRNYRNVRENLSTPDKTAAITVPIAVGVILICIGIYLGYNYLQKRRFRNLASRRDVRAKALSESFWGDDENFAPPKRETFAQVVV